VRGAEEAAEVSEQRIRRVTIRDIAERAGVSKGAVSYGLNGRPGVSDETRGRILAIADELASAAEPVMGKLDRIPAAIVRGLALAPSEEGSKALLRDPARDLFR